MNKLFLALTLFSFSATYAQLPDTDIFLLDLKQSAYKIELGEPTNITNRMGYDNQPSFMADNTSILFTSIKDNQADVYKYNVLTKETTQVTSTATEHEYSPTQTPDKLAISAVEVDKDSIQRLWRIPLKSGQQSVILPDVDSVGYHCWLNPNTLALFLLTNNTLALADVKTGKLEILAKNIGRCLQRKPGKDDVLLYVDKADSTKWFIKSYDLKTKRNKVIINTLSGSEDYAILPDGTLLMGSHGILYKYKPGIDKDWQVVKDLSTSIVKDFYRIAVSPDGKRICLVSKALPKK